MKTFFTRLSLSLVCLIAVGLSLPALAHAAPTGFTNQLLTAGLSLPTDFAFAPDGRIFVSQQNGQVQIFKNNQLLQNHALDLAVGTGGDRGLVSITLDPNFATNGYVYLLYTSTTLHERISRFTVMPGMDMIDPASEVVLLQDATVWNGFLNAGAVRFGLDGKIYASLGSNGAGLATQDVSNLEGKVVRINADGTIPTDNPFYNFPGAVKSIYALGFRNPWKLNIAPDGHPIVGDVGETQYEKIVRVMPGANYGWPTSEGDCTPNCNGITPPLAVTAHNGAGSALVGGDIYTGNNFPATYHGAYFFGDYVQGTIKYVTLSQNYTSTGIQSFDTGDGSIAALNMGPDGCLYYLDIFPGQLHQMCYGANQSITAVASVDKNSGGLPLNVQFSSASSTGTVTNYQWNFGDGTTSTSPNPAHTYPTKGVYSVTLTATGPSGASTSNLTIRAGFLPPTATITAPIALSKYSAGDTIHFSATASDPQDGPLAQGAFLWSIIPHHNTHIHTPVEYNGVTGGDFTIPTAGEPDPNTWYEFKLTVTDSIGLSTTTSTLIYPNIPTITFNSNVPGLQVLVDGQPFTLPYSTQSVAGIARTMAVNSPQTINGSTYTFGSWSDGGAQTHAFASPLTPTTYTVQFNQSATNTPNPTPNPTPTPVNNAGDSLQFDKTTYAPGDAVNLTTTIHPSQTIPNAIVDTEIYNAANVKVAQNFTATNLTTNVDYSTNWNFTAPALGTYKVKVAIFKSDWSVNYYWDDTAGTLTVSNAAPTPTPTPVPPSGTTQVFTDTVATDKAQYAAGEMMNMSTGITATQSLNNALIDTEVYNTAGAKVLQNFTTANLVANQKYTAPWTVTTPAVGNYIVKMGVFASDWSKLYYWDSTATTFTVVPKTTPIPTPTPVPPPTPTLTFAVAASLPTNVYTAGVQAPVTTAIAATQDIANVHVHTEIYDLNNVKVSGTVVDTNLVANQQFSSTWNTPMPMQNGQYVIKVGVFSNDYSKVYFWKNNAFNFTVGTPPSAPVPGVTYPLNTLVPKDGDTVTGVQEIRASITGLDPNLYSIGWRTGAGDYFPLDTEPVTQSYKHAWIDFGVWNWNPANSYPLEFEATDQNGAVIGHSLIHITVTH